MKDNIIYTDGACSGNPGPGGYGAVVLLSNDKVKEIGGAEGPTTNNRMEMLAIKEALELIDNKAPVQVYTDSSYVINGITKWIHGWKKNNWQTADKKEVLNKDLWVQLERTLSLVKGTVSFHYVPGHSNVSGNERCDEIAVAFSKWEPISLYSGELSGYSIDLRDKPDLEALKKKKASSKSNKGKKAYSYVSRVNGVVCVDKTWPECEARVKGQKGALFKKALNKAEEEDLVKSWS